LPVLGLFEGAQGVIELILGDEFLIEELLCAVEVAPRELDVG
jgi:hypothetical protein